MLGRCGVRKHILPNLAKQLSCSVIVSKSFAAAHHTLAGLISDQALKSLVCTCKCQRADIIKRPVSELIAQQLYDLRLAAAKLGKLSFGNAAVDLP